MFENIIYSDYGSTCCKTFFSKIEIVGTTCTHETYRVGHAMDMPAPKKWPDAQRPSPKDVLRGIMTRQLESEAAMAKITANTMDATSLEKLDHLVREAKQADDEVWMALEASMEAAAAKHGWLAVKKHFEYSDVHDSLKARISAKLDAGILSDERARQLKLSTEALISWKIRDRSKDERVRLIVRYMIHNTARELQPLEVDDMCEMVKKAKDMSDDLLVKWVCASLGDSKLASDFVAELEAVKTAEALRAAGAESWLVQTKKLEDLVVSDVEDKSMEPQMRSVVRDVVLHCSDTETLLSKISDRTKLEALRKSVTLFAKMTDEEIAHEMQKAEIVNDLARAKFEELIPENARLREHQALQSAELEVQTKYVEDLIVGEVPDPRMEEMLRLNFRKMIGDAEGDKRALLAKMSDPNRADELRLAVKRQLESTAIKEMVKKAEISDPSKRVQVENALERVYRQSQHVGNLVSSGVTDPTMEEKMRSVVRIMIVEDLDLDKLVSKISDPKELSALRTTVEALAEMPDEKISKAVRAFVEDSKRLDGSSDNSAASFGLDALNQADLKKHMQQVEDAVVRDLVDPPLEAQARLHVRKLFKKNTERICGFLTTMLDMKVLQEVRANVKAAVALEQLHLEEQRKNKARRAELMADNRRGQVMMKQEIEARKAAEAKASRMAQALVREEMEAKLAAEHRAERKAEKEREAQHRKAMEAAEREAQKVAEREAIEAADRQRKAAQREARERQAAQREARRQEAEDRRAIALVEAHCAVQARRAAKKAEKRAAKAQQEPDDTCGICYEPFDAKKKMPMFSKCGDSQHECVMCLQCLLGLANAADGKDARCVCGRDKVVFKMWEPK